jgi:uncharacterized protein YeaO (DUF488 family)
MSEEDIVSRKRPSGRFPYYGRPTEPVWYSSCMKIQVKRAYDEVSKGDGLRVLVDRLWPRGVRKTGADIDLWAKGVTPSNELRAWFHSDPEGRFREFSKRYKREVAKSAELQTLKQALRGKKTITLVTGVKDIEHSHIPTLLSMLQT